MSHLLPCTFYTTRHHSVTDFSIREGQRCLHERSLVPCVLHLVLVLRIHETDMVINLHWNLCSKGDKPGVNRVHIYWPNSVTKSWSKHKRDNPLRLSYTSSKPNSVTDSHMFVSHLLPIPTTVYWRKLLTTSVRLLSRQTGVFRVNRGHSLYRGILESRGPLRYTLII